MRSRREWERFPGITDEEFLKTLQDTRDEGGTDQDAIEVARWKDHDEKRWQEQYDHHGANWNKRR